MTYEVQHLVSGCWFNNWVVYDSAMTPHPQEFPTVTEAQAALDEFFEDIAEYIREETRNPDEGYSRSEFRIVPVGTGSDTDVDDLSRQEETVAKSAKELWDEIYAYLQETEQESFDVFIDDEGGDPDNHILGKAHEFNALFNHKLDSNKTEEEDDNNRCS